MGLGEAGVEATSTKMGSPSSSNKDPVLTQLYFSVLIDVVNGP